MTIINKCYTDDMDFSLIGLTIRDKRVYEALVQLPESSVRKIADEIRINRGSVFESLKDLLKAGLVTRVLYGRRVMYRAKDPEILREILEEKRQNITLAKNSVGAYIQSFDGQANDPELFHFTSLYKGDEGLASILRDVLKTCRVSGTKEYRSISSPRVSRYLYNNFPHFSNERVKQEIFVRILRQGARVSERMGYAEDRYLGTSPYDTGCYTLIYCSKVAIITIDKYNDTSGVIVDNQSFADIQRQMFDVMWEVGA